MREAGEHLPGIRDVGWVSATAPSTARLVRASTELERPPSPIMLRART